MFDVFGNFDSVEELNACAKGLLEEQDLEHLKVLAEENGIPDGIREEFEKLGQTQKEKEKFTKIMLMEDNDARRRMSELCMQQKKMIVNPIIDWTHSDIWGYINSEKIETCDLYQCGYDRVGCIGCPMAGKKRYKEFADFPKYKQLYINAFDRMLKERERRGKECKWTTGEEVFLWWMEDENIPGQMSIEDFIAEE